MEEESKMIKGYPYLSYSKQLIEYFAIIGYEESLIEDMLSSSLSLSQSLPPSILSSITSMNNPEEIWDNSMILKQIYPNIPKIQSHPIEPSSMIFSVCFDSFSGDKKQLIACYSYLFYEQYRTHYYIPKAFCIVSQYPFFSTFKTICTQLHSLFNTNTAIPPEYIIYSIVNYSPSPLTDNIEYRFFDNIPSIKLDKLSGYPYIDFNLLELFNYLPLSMVIEIFLLTIIEVDVVFFSENLEMLNMIMYIMSLLNYPCNDSNYFWHIVSLSKEEFFDDNNPFSAKLTTTILGVNAAFDESTAMNNKRSPYHVVDLDNKKLYYLPCLHNSNQRDEKDKMKLMEYFRKIIREKSLDSKFLRKYILELQTNIDALLKKSIQNYPCYSKSKYVNFFICNDEIKATNHAIQLQFYNFYLNIMKVFYEDNVLASSFDKISARESLREDNTLFVRANENVTGLAMEEKIFCSAFRSTFKYNIYFVNFIQDFKCLKLYKIPLLFSEEFINVKITYTSEREPLKDLYFDIMDEFYLYQKGIYKTVSYTELNSFILKNKHHFHIEDNTSSNDSCIIKKTSSKKAKKSLIKVNTTLLLYFINIMNNLDDNVIESLISFSSLNNDLIPLVERDKITDIIEAKLNENDSITTKALIIQGMIYFFAMMLSMGKFEMNHLNQLKKNLKYLTFFKRKYLNVILNTIYKIFQYDLTLNKKDKNPKFSPHLVKLYHFLFVNFIRHEHILPNQQMMLVLKNWSNLIKKSSEVEDNDDTDELENNAVFQYDQIESTLNNAEFKIVTKYCFNRVGMIKTEDLMQIALSEFSNINIILPNTNNTCNNERNSISGFNKKSSNHSFSSSNSSNERKPILAVKYDNEEHETELYSPLKLYNLAKYLHQEYLTEMSVYSLERETLKKAFINIVFYSENLPWSECPSRLLALCLLILLKEK